MSYILGCNEVQYIPHRLVWGSSSHCYVTRWKGSQDRGGVAYLNVGGNLSVPLIGGTKSPVWSPNLGYICYREGNLIVIEKCYSWQNCCETDVYNGKYYRHCAMWSMCRRHSLSRILVHTRVVHGSIFITHDPTQPTDIQIQPNPTHCHVNLWTHDPTQPMPNRIQDIIPPDRIPPPRTESLRTESAIADRSIYICYTIVWSGIYSLHSYIPLQTVV